MKNQIISAMLALALTGSIAAAQTADRAPVENIGARNSVSNALSPADRSRPHAVRTLNPKRP